MKGKAIAKVSSLKSKLEWNLKCLLKVLMMKNNGINETSYQKVT